MKLTDDFLVWREGIEWTKISEIAELSGFVIKTPPPLPFEIQKQEERESENKIREYRIANSGEIVVRTLINGFILAIIFSFIMAKIAEQGGSGANAIFHGPGMETFTDFFWPIFFRVLMILEAIGLIIAGYKFATLRPNSSTKQHNENSRSFSVFRVLGLLTRYILNLVKF